MKGLLFLAIAAVSFALAGVVSGAADSGDRTRVQAHLDRVAHLLRASPPPHLTPEQLSARRVTLDWLDEYRTAGVFPHNHVLPNTRTSIFVDPHGTPCAVGYLLLRSGEHELVEEVVHADNLIRVPDLEGDPRVAHWLDTRGLTMEEAALIQPAYDWSPPDIGAQNTSYYVPTTVGLSIATAALVSYNAIAGTDRGGPLVDGLLVGAALGHLALLADDDSGEHHASAGLNAVGLFAAVGTEVVRLMRGGDEGVGADSRLSSHLAPGPNGMEFGLTLRH